MIVPKYWAEGRAFHRRSNRQVTVRRFGWSNESEADAQLMADDRANEALQLILSGERLPRRELKVGYNGADGVPIREEIVSTYGSTVITRNSYGALCMNTPDTLFADIDFTHEPHLVLALVVFLATVLAHFYIGWIQHQKMLQAFFLITSLSRSIAIAWGAAWVISKVFGNPENVARRRIARFVDSHREWNLRLYRTPAGFRVLATHQQFVPTDPAVNDCFRALGADRLYVKMCLKQHCFRARVSPKPWRIGIDAHLKPRPGVWPISADRMPDRLAWVEKYERAASGYAACEFIESVGSGIVSSQIRDVIELHDKLSQATSGRPIA